MLLFRALIILYLCLSQAVAFSPARLPSRPHSRSQSRASTDKSVDEAVTAIVPLPGRPTPRFFSFLFDDTARLLNPRTMGSYQVKRKKQFGPVFKTNIFFRPTVFVTDEASLNQIAPQEASNKLEQFFPPQVVACTNGRKSCAFTSSYSTESISIQSYRETVEKSIERFLRDLKKNHSTDYAAMVPLIRSFFSALPTRIKPWPTWLEIPRFGPKVYSPFVPWSTAAKAMRARKRIVQQLCLASCRFSDIFCRIGYSTRMLVVLSDQCRHVRNITLGFDCQDP